MNRPGSTLITGATGFIGYALAQELSAQGLRPRLLVRRPLRATLLRSLDAEIVQGDLESPPSLARAVEGVETVFHLGARAIFEEYERVRPTIVGGSVSLMEAARTAGVRRFVYSSSMLVYSSQAGPVDQSTPPRPVVGYGRAKIEAESRLREMAEACGMKLAVIRLPHVYGARDLMFEQIRQGRVIFPGSGENRFGHLHVEDAVRVLTAVAEHEWEGTSPVADDLPATWNEFFEVVKEYYPRFRSLGMPMELALLGTQLLTPLRRLRRHPSLYTPDAVRGWNLSVFVEPGLLWKELGLEPHYPTIHSGVPAALDDSVAFRWIHPVADRMG